MNTETVERIVEIPVLIGSNFYTTKHVILNWQCPVCGGTRGEVYRTQAYDGSLRVNCDGWQNPCGHIDMYEAVLKEAQALQDGKAQPIEPILDVMLNPDVPAHTDAFLSGDVARLHAAAAHDPATVDQAQGLRGIAPNMSPREIEASQQQQAVMDAMLAEKNARIAQLEALLAEAKQVCAPIAEMLDNIDGDGIQDGQFLHVRTTRTSFECLFIPSLEEYASLKHLRVIAAFAAKLDDALK